MVLSTSSATVGPCCDFASFSVVSASYHCFALADGCGKIITHNLGCVQFSSVPSQTPQRTSSFPQGQEEDPVAGHTCPQRHVRSGYATKCGGVIEVNIGRTLVHRSAAGYLVTHTDHGQAIDKD